MRRVKLTIEYDGTDFVGFQTQTPGSRTVQSVLNSAIATIARQPVNVTPAGRTDSGVHALGQVVHFDIDTRLSCDRIESALNSLLPRDISVRQAVEVNSKFNARFSAVRRRYLYVVLNRPQRSALWDRYSLHVPHELNIEAMRRSAISLIGSHDFSSFANVGGDPGSTKVRTLESIKIRRVQRDEMIVFSCTANAFLRSMVRNLVGSLLDVGRGAMQSDALVGILNERDRTKNPCATIPAKGLCLYRVDYSAVPIVGSPANEVGLVMDEEG